MLRTARPGLACLGVFLLLTPGLAQVRTIDTERGLSTRFGFTPAEMGRVRSGQPVVRRLLLGHAQAYLKGGDDALGVYHNEKTPRVAAEQFRQILWQSKHLCDPAPQFAAYLEGFPTARLPGAEQFLYWAKGGVGPEASITLHQLAIYRATGGEVFVADKQLYASRYSDAAMAVISLATTPDGAGYYALVGARARSSVLSGVAHGCCGAASRAPRGTPRRCTSTGSDRACRQGGREPRPCK